MNTSSDTLTLALPTGRVLSETAALVSRAGLPLPEKAVRDRKLRLSADSQGARDAFLLVKDPDVPTYVEHGVADAGIVGQDILLEHEPDVYQPLDLGIGRCRMVVARRKDSPAGHYHDLPLVRVATKYPRLCARHFHGRGIPIDVIPLAGSVELAPVMGLADCIVDMVETGRTLEANGLVVDEVLFESTARLIINRTRFRLKLELLTGLIEDLERVARS